MNARPLALAVVPVVLVAAGCGGGGKKAATTSPSTTTTPTATTTTYRTTTQSSSPGALQAEAATLATGDIPDTQIYLVYRSPAGWSMKYPEGWAQSGSPKATLFRDKNNIVRIVVGPGSAPTAAQARSDRSLRGARITAAPAAIGIKGRRALKLVYSTQSAPSPVTGKRVTLTVDRYYLARTGKVATIDLGTPVGVDNVDAYRLMIESFRWR
ncbi:MAG: hypothetical protein WBB76_01185 [Gaiellaceae bacterium]